LQWIEAPLALYCHISHPRRAVNVRAAHILGGPGAFAHSSGPSPGMPSCTVCDRALEAHFTEVSPIGFGAAGYVTVALAPGAEKVKMTNDAGDVASCKAVGNVKAQTMGPEATNATPQNQTFGLGGNTIFVTGTNAGSVTGVAYSCP